jgi:hypothetical protein
MNVGELVDYLENLPSDTEILIASDKFPEDASDLVDFFHINPSMFTADRPGDPYVLLTSKASRDNFNAAQDAIK